MNHYFKLSIVWFLSWPLYGCGNLSNPVEVQIEPDLVFDEWTNQVKDHSLIVVTSLENEPIQIQHISVNRGACKIQRSQGNGTLTHYSSLTKYQLLNCDMNMIKEVELKINGKRYTYTF